MLKLRHQKNWPKVGEARQFPAMPAVAPLIIAWWDAGLEAAEQTRFNGATTARVARLQSAEDNKNEEFRRIFISGNARITIVKDHEAHSCDTSTKFLYVYQTTNDNTRNVSKEGLSGRCIQWSESFSFSKHHQRPLRTKSRPGKYGTTAQSLDRKRSSQ